MFNFSSQSKKSTGALSNPDMGMAARPFQKQQIVVASSVAGEVSNQQIQWDKEFESLDKKEMELHQTQMKLLREQMMNFVRDLAGVRDEMNEVRLQRETEANQMQVFHEELHRDKQDMQNEIVALVQALQEDFKGHTSKLDEVAAVVGDGAQNHRALEERFGLLHRSQGDLAQKHGKELSSLKDAHDGHARLFDDHREALQGHHASFAERLEDIERVLGLNAERHTDGLADAHSRLDTLHNRLATVEKYGPALDELRRSHGGLAKEKEMLSTHHASLKERLQDMEKGMADSLDKHWSHIQIVTLSHEKHGAAMSKHAKDLEGLRADKQAHHEAMLERLDLLDQVHGEAADKHASGFSQLHGKLQSAMDRLAGVEKHGQHIGDLRRSHDDLAQRKSELESHHSTLAERVNYLEQLIGDNADKHAKELKALCDRHSRHAKEVDGLKGLHSKHSTVEERLNYIEQIMGDSADKHAEELAELKRAHEQLHNRVGTCEGHGAAVNDLRKSHGGLEARKAELERHHASMQERVEYLEGLLNDSADKHTEKMDAAHSRLNEMHGRLSAFEKHAAAVLELKRGHSELSDHKNALARDFQALKDRLEDMEVMFGDASNRHAKDLKGLRGSHDKQAAMLTKHASQLDRFGLHQEHHATLPERVEFLEKQFGDSADTHVAHVADLHKKISGEQAAREKHHGLIKDFFAREQEQRDKHHASLAERVDYLEGVMGTNADQHSKELRELASGHQKLMGETKSRAESHAVMMERVGKLERSLIESVEKNSNDIRATKAKFESFTNRMSAVKSAWGQDTPRIPS